MMPQSRWKENQYGISLGSIPSLRRKSLEAGQGDETRTDSASTTTSPASALPHPWPTLPWGQECRQPYSSLPGRPTGLLLPFGLWVTAKGLSTDGISVASQQIPQPDASQPSAHCPLDEQTFRILPSCYLKFQDKLSGLKSKPAQFFHLLFQMLMDLWSV